MSDNIELFEDQKIRTAWDEENEEWYFSVVDVVGVLTEQHDYDGAKNYWKVLKHRLARDENELVTKCNQLKLKSPKDGKRYKTDVANTEQLLRIIQSKRQTVIPSLLCHSERSKESHIYIAYGLHYSDLRSFALLRMTMAQSRFVQI